MLARPGTETLSLFWCTVRVEEKTFYNNDVRSTLPTTPTSKPSPTLTSRRKKVSTTSLSTSHSLPKEDKGQGLDLTKLFEAAFFQMLS